MKLIDKLTMWFILVVFLVTPISMVISYRSIKDNILSAEVTRLVDVNNEVAQQIRSGQTPHKYMLDRPITITKVKSLPVKKTFFNTVHFQNEHLDRQETRLDVSSFYKINDVVYRISTYNYITEGKLILNGMLKALFWKMLIVSIGMAISGRLISKNILLPFQRTLNSVQKFSLKQSDKIVFTETKTAEFKELNHLLKKMTDRAIDDYARMKEFSENASHEMQTPLAIIRSKLELFTETAINEDQAKLIDDMQNAIEKLVKINRSLLLLTKLDNQEFEAKEEICIGKITNDVINTYTNWGQTEDITITRDIDEGVKLQMNPVLAEILLNNLISNAIRYNTQAGSINIQLNHTGLTITNTGLPPEIDTGLLFERFKKSNQSADSVGLGLAIVKQICTVTNLGVSYDYAKGLHTISVTFTLQNKYLNNETALNPVEIDNNAAFA